MKHARTQRMKSRQPKGGTNRVVGFKERPGRYKIITEGDPCSICGKNYLGYGNNAYPINNGRCCDQCNADTVIPARLADMITQGFKKIVKGER